MFRRMSLLIMELSVKFVVVSHSIYSFVVTAGDEASGHVRPSSSLRFEQYGLDRGGWLALVLGVQRYSHSVTQHLREGVDSHVR